MARARNGQKWLCTGRCQRSRSAGFERVDDAQQFLHSVTWGSGGGVGVGVGVGLLYVEPATEIVGRGKHEI